MHIQLLDGYDTMDDGDNFIIELKHDDISDYYMFLFC